MSARQRGEVVLRQKASHEKFLLPAGVGFFILIICAFFLIANPLGLITSALAIILLAAGMGLGALVFGGAFFRLMGEIKGETRRYEVSIEGKAREHKHVKEFAEQALNQKAQLLVTIFQNVRSLSSIRKAKYNAALIKLKEAPEALLEFLGGPSALFSNKESIQKIQQSLIKCQEKIQNKISNLLEGINPLEFNSFVTDRIQEINFLYDQLKKEVSPIKIKPKSNSRHLVSRLSTFGLILVGLGGIFLATFYPIAFSFLVITISILMIAAGIVGLSLSYYLVALRALEEQKRMDARFIFSGQDKINKSLKELKEKSDSVDGDFRQKNNLSLDLEEKRQDIPKAKESPSGTPSSETPPSTPTGSDADSKEGRLSDAGSEGHSSNPSGASGGSDVSFKTSSAPSSPAASTPTLTGRVRRYSDPILNLTTGLPEEKKGQGTLLLEKEKLPLLVLGSAALGSAQNSIDGERSRSQRSGEIPASTEEDEGSDGSKESKKSSNSPFSTYGRIGSGLSSASAPPSPSKLPPSPSALPRNSSFGDIHNRRGLRRGSFPVPSPLRLGRRVVKEEELVKERELVVTAETDKNKKEVAYEMSGDLP